MRAQLYDRAASVCLSIPIKTLQSGKDVDSIVSSLYKRDLLSAVSHLYDDFLTLINTKHEVNESFKHFESLVSAQLSRYNAH